RRAGLPAGFFQQEKIYVTTAELFALWRAVGQTSSDPVIGLKLGSELRLERNDPAAIAAFCSRTFRDAVQRIAFHKQLTCPEEIRIRTVRDEASVEFAFIRAEGDEPDVLVDICLSWIVSIGRNGTETAGTSARRKRSSPERAHTPTPTYRCGDYVSATGGRNAPRTCAPPPETKHRRIDRSRLLARLRGCELILSRISRMGRNFT